VHYVIVVNAVHNRAPYLDSRYERLVPFIPSPSHPPQTSNHHHPYLPSTIYMVDKLTSPTTSNFGRVFAVLRKSPLIDGNPSSTIGTALVKALLPMLTIGSPTIADAAQQRVNVNIAERTKDPYGDESGSRRVQEDIRTGLTIAAPMVEAIPVAGPPLKAAVGGILEILKAVDVSYDAAPIS